jgi:fructokinase
VEDTVGAGDAFLSTLLSGLLAGRGGAPLLDLANRLGAYVASHSGASPDYEVKGLDDIEQLPLRTQTHSEAGS